MSLTTEQIISARNPVLFAATARMNALIVDAEETLDEGVYGDKYARAVALLTMHNYTKDISAAGGGALTSEAEGRVSRSYGDSGGTDDWLSTRWGKELYELTSLCNGGSFVTRQM